jgi:hypothetical protein
LKCEYYNTDVIAKLAESQMRKEGKNIFSLHNMDKMTGVRLKVVYNGKFGSGTFYLTINFDGTLEIHYKDLDYGEPLLKALAYTLLEGNEDDGETGHVDWNKNKKAAITMNVFAFQKAMKNTLEKYGI